MDDEERKRKENFPEEYDGSLDCSSLALNCSFNRSGSLLAVGCNDGRIVIWDFLNRKFARNIAAHAGHPVSFTSWSRNGRKLASSSLDNTMAIWNVLTAECLIRWVSKGPLMKVQFHPRNENLVLVCALKHAPILLEVDYETGKVEHKFISIDSDDSDSSIVASFDRRGEYIYSGVKGRVIIFACPSELNDTTEINIFASFKIQTVGSAPAAIRGIEFAAKNKNFFLINSTDRSIRLYSCESALNAGINGSCEEVRRFQDTVNKAMWKRCSFSGDREATFVCGGSSRQNAIYIWPTEDGTVKKILQGTQRETLLDIQWHPSKPIVVSISSGMILIWARAEVENWSAYAPQFKELEENQEYSELESEFDLEDEDANRKMKPKEITTDSEDEEIDIENLRNGDDDYRSSDEEDNDTTALEFIPVSMEDHEMVEMTQH